MIKRTKNPNGNKCLFNKTFDELNIQEKDQLLKILAEKFNLIQKRKKIKDD